MYQQCGDHVTSARCTQVILVMSQVSNGSPGQYLQFFSSSDVMPQTQDLTCHLSLAHFCANYRAVSSRANLAMVSGILYTGFTLEP